MRKALAFGFALFAVLCLAAAAAPLQAQELLKLFSTKSEANPQPKPQVVAQAQTGSPIKRVRPPQPGSQLRVKMKEQLNEWTLGLAAGRIEGAPLRLAAELARALDDGDNFRLLPIVTRGIFDNFNDLLYLRGIDLAIVYGDVLQHFRATEKIPNVENRVTYIANLFPAEMHVLVGPEINSMKDLEGKAVNFNTQGTAAAYTGPIVFDRLGIKIQKEFRPHREVMANMKKGSKEIAAVVFVSSKPIAPIATKWPPGFKLLPIDYGKALEEYYLPATLDAKDYPGLIAADSKVNTIAVPAVLAVYNWGADTDRRRRLDRMIGYMFERWPSLHKEPYDAKWKDVNLAATVPGWKRYEPMQAKLDALMPKPAATATRGRMVEASAIREQVEKAAPGSKAEQERLFQQFLEWKKKRQAE